MAIVHFCEKFGQWVNVRLYGSPSIGCISKISDLKHREQREIPPVSIKKDFPSELAIDLCPHMACSAFGHVL